MPNDDHSPKLCTEPNPDKLIYQYGTAAESLYNRMVKRLKFENKTLTKAERGDLCAAALQEFDSNPSAFSPLDRAHIEGEALYNPGEKQKRQMVGMIIQYSLSYIPGLADYQALYGRYLKLKSPTR